MVTLSIEVLTDTVTLIIAFVAVLTTNLSAVVLGQCRCSAHYKPTYMYY